MTYVKNFFCGMSVTLAVLLAAAFLAMRYFGVM